MNDLTVNALRSIKANGKIQILRDGGGLSLRVTASGKASWRLEYRCNNERLSKTLGLYPVMSLADARRERDRIKSDIAGGVVPEMGISASGGRTFGDLGSEYLTRIRKSGLNRKTLDRHVWLVNDLAAPLHDRPILSIKPANVLAVLHEIAESGRRDSALRLRAVLRNIFDRAIIVGEVEANPVAPLGKSLPPANTKNHPAVTDEREFGKLLLALDSVALPTNRHALQFMALCYSRPGETRRAAWNQIDWEKAQWIVPAEIMKMSREHVIPLSRQALDILKRQREISGGGHFIFRNSVGNGIMSPATLNKVLERLGYGTPHHVPHGFRSSASTILNERGWRYDVIEASLAHVEGNAVRRAYNRALYLKERIEMAQGWADLCDEFRAKAYREAEIQAFL